MAKSSSGTRSRERLSREVIVAGAVALADADGLDAVTIRRLAQEHAVTPMALYWHFRDKEELFEGIAEYLFAKVELPPADSGPWTQQLRTVLTAFVAALRPHPAVAGLTAARILDSEPGLTLAERVLSLLRQAGFSVERAAEIGGYILSAVVTLVTTEPGTEHGSDAATREDAIRVKAASLGALSPQRYPHVVASAGALAVCASPDTYYLLGIDILVTGIRTIAETKAF